MKFTNGYWMTKPEYRMNFCPLYPILLKCSRA